VTAATVLILGATSDIGSAVARTYRAAGYDIILAGRNETRLAEEARALTDQTHGAPATAVCDVLVTGVHGPFLDRLSKLPDTVVCIVGYSGDQKSSQNDAAAAEHVMRTNYVGPALLLGEIARRMEQRGHGSIVAISSVTGERGRAKNYVYGSAKAGLTAFLSGLRQRLAGTGVHVVTVVAGYCNTRKMAGKSMPRFLTSQPQQVADAILAAERAKKNVIYVLPIWRPIMLLVRLIPEQLFKKFSF
jgi:short-subunit dehydrogenase